MATGDAAKGALGGATAGAAFGPIGALVGGLGGGLLGYLGGRNSGPQPGQLQEQQLLALAEEARLRGAPQDAGLSDFRGDQRDYLNRVKALASGQGPSLATEMLRANTAQAAANQTAMAAGARGNPALAARSAMNNTAGMTAQANQAGAMARAQEQLGALQQYGIGSYSARGQDEEMARFNAAQRLRAEQQRDATRLGALGGSYTGTQMASQAPTAGDYVMGGAAGLGQILALARSGGARKVDSTGNPGVWG